MEVKEEEEEVEKEEEEEEEKEVQEKEEDEDEEGVLPPRIISLGRRCKVVSKLIQWRLIEDKHKFFEEVEKRLRIGARCKGVPGVKVEARYARTKRRRLPPPPGCGPHL
ncbi:hypothetical protein HZH68_009230 [Vespula germanica]|uniref:Uncharacterized protein n=1 Tax=Vespula germanica TaxID=30212 RepID=A0A834N476_VESGE|nr:hypothetical protein HZH68_009230 [Vespula germanica]